MERALALVVIAHASACGFSGSSGGASDAPPVIEDAPLTDGTDGPLPEDAGVDGSQTLDSDGDTIVDADDNCPTVPNLDQRNFDEDARGDACDPCPHLANQDDDPDGDGIGVGCDPRPGAVDQRLLWTSFHDPSAIVGWVFPAGSWLVEGGRLRQTDATVDYGLAAPPLGASLPRVLIATRYTLDALGSIGGGVDTTGIGAASANATGQYYACIVSKGMVNTRLYAAADWPGGTGNSSALESVAWPGTFAGNSKINLVHHTRENNHCVASQGNTTVMVESSRGTGLNGVLYLYTQRAAGSFEYMFVVGIGD